jgi:hypothetical protein
MLVNASRDSVEESHHVRPGRFSQTEAINVAQSRQRNVLSMKHLLRDYLASGVGRILVTGRGCVHLHPKRTVVKQPSASYG